MLNLCLLGSPRSAHAQPSAGTEVVVAPKQVYAPSVPYPSGATGDGRVVLELEIAQDGTVARVTARAGQQPFVDAASAGVQSWRFDPATRDGVAVRARILVEISFSEPAPAIAALPPGEEAPAAPEEIRVLGERRQELGSTFIPREDARRIPG
ncbi:MAG: TonB family protein, partial [Polyangiaceae bacterium]